MGGGRSILSFVKSYAEHFISYWRDVSEQARQYVSGLIQAGSRKNIHAISEVGEREIFGGPGGCG